jgi:hypothetical protein
MRDDNAEREETSMLDRAIATQQGKRALAETARARASLRASWNARSMLRLFKERCSRLLRAAGEFIAAGGPLS